MILEVQHETRLAYSEPVSESMAEMRMEPPSDNDQSVRSFHLSVTPYTEAFRYHDGFGNRVHHFSLLSRCQEIRVVASSLVETHPQPRDLHASRTTFPLDPEQIDLSARSFLTLRGPAAYTPRLDPLRAELAPRAGMPVGELVKEIAAYICQNFEYAKYYTLASSPIDDVLRQRKGVCQDFTHLMIALVRSFGIPARYVSGYIHRPNFESQSHAWCEVWLPDLNWYGIDPTNNRETNDNFVRVATGRDFTDVPPNKGVYRGQADEQIFVRVETRELVRLPALTWQETLPTFEVPLTSIATRSCLQEAGYDESQQQQQQAQQQQ